MRKCGTFRQMRQDFPIRRSSSHDKLDATKSDVSLKIEEKYCLYKHVPSSKNNIIVHWRRKSRPKLIGDNFIPDVAYPSNILQKVKGDKLIQQQNFDSIKKVVPDVIGKFKKRKQKEDLNRRHAATGAESMMVKDVEVNTSKHVIDKEVMTIECEKVTVCTDSKDLDITDIQSICGKQEIIKKEDTTIRVVSDGVSYVERFPIKNSSDHNCSVSNHTSSKIHSEFSTIDSLVCTKQTLYNVTNYTKRRDQLHSMNIYTQPYNLLEKADKTLNSQQSTPMVQPMIINDAKTDTSNKDVIALQWQKQNVGTDSQNLKEFGIIASGTQSVHYEHKSTQKEDDSLSTKSIGVDCKTQFLTSFINGSTNGSSPKHRSKLSAIISVAHMNNFRTINNKTRHIKRITKLQGIGLAIDTQLHTLLDQLISKFLTKRPNFSSKSYSRKTVTDNTHETERQDIANKGDLCASARSNAMTKKSKSFDITTDYTIGHTNSQSYSTIPTILNQTRNLTQKYGLSENVIYTVRHKATQMSQCIIQDPAVEEVTTFQSELVKKRGKSGLRTVGTQMYEHTSPNTLYCKEWIRQYLFYMDDVNPYTVIVDSKVPTISIMPSPSTSTLR